MKSKLIKIAKTVLLSAGIVLAGSCNKNDKPIDEPSEGYPEKAFLNKRTIINTVGSVKVYSGGYGSAAALGADGFFYIMTDRGPNIDGSGKDEKGIL